MHRSPLRCAALALCASVLCWGCSGEPPPPPPPPDDGPSCPLPFLGDKEKTPEMELIVLRADSTSAPLRDGDTVAMIFPPQGGRVIFAGIRATNIDPCGVKLAGALRDPVTKQVRVDGRTINLTPSGDGWGGSDDADISSFANVPVCPNQWAKADLFGNEYELSLVLEDRHDHTLTRTVKVIPSCAEPEYAAECACICKGGYVLGEKCDVPDGGSDDGGTDGGADGGGSAADGGM
jgi:hypothetical protein